MPCQYHRGTDPAARCHRGHRCARQRGQGFTDATLARCQRTSPKHRVPETQIEQGERCGGQRFAFGGQQAQQPPRMVRRQTKDPRLRSRTGTTGCHPRRDALQKTTVGLCQGLRHPRSPQHAGLPARAFLKKRRRRRLLDSGCAQPPHPTARRHDRFPLHRQCTALHLLAPLLLQLSGAVAPL